MPEAEKQDLREKNQGEIKLGDYSKRNPEFAQTELLLLLRCKVEFDRYHDEKL